jgi:glycosyltransferase involved in cell wall biosynthesis
MSIRISVVIPTYNRPALLRNCLIALTNQSIEKSVYEVLVVSDGYDTATEEAVNTLAKQFPFIQYLHLPQKKGPAAARNWGWKEAQAPLVAFTDDDTLPDVHWLSAYCEAYRNETFMALTGPVKVPISSLPTDYEKNTAGLETAEFVTANCCCTKAALEAVRGFDERFSMAWREDSDLHFKLMMHQIPIKKVSQALVVHPVRQAPWGVSIKEQKKGFFNALLYKKYPQLYRQRIQPSPMWDYYIIVCCLLLVVIGIYQDNAKLSIVAALGWSLLTIRFIIKRLAFTRHSASHIGEMIVTSIAIPFLSVYWQLYGAVKYRVLFI